MSPRPPVNVRLVLHDGTVLAVDCRYVGIEDDLHTWEVIEDRLGPITVVKVLVDELPGRTTLRLPIR